MTTGKENVIADLRRGYESLTLAQKRIAELIVEDPEFVAFATVEKLAGRLDVSPSTVVRFAYRLGLDGYPDLQDRVRDVVRVQMRPALDAAGGGRSVTGHLGDGVIASSLSHDIDNLQRTVARLALDDLERAVSVLAGARAIYVTGGFASDSLAQYTGLALSRMRGNTTVLTGDVHTPPKLLDLTADDALLAFSFAPYARRTLQVVSAAKSRRTAIVAITDTPVAPVAQQADVLLATNVSGIGPQNSLVAPMAVASALLNAIVLEVPGAGERHARVLELMSEFHAFLLSADGE